MSDVVRRIGGVVFLSVAILFLMVGIVVVNGCCGGGNKTAATAVGLVIEDSHSGVWMPFDNGWTKKGTIAWTKWDGVVIQLGKFFKYNQNGDRGKAVESSWIQFENDTGGKVKLQMGQFDWINIVSENPGAAQAPITKEQGYVLFPNQYSQTVCDKVDTCPDRTKLPSAAADCTETLEKVPQPCMRLRSLHATFEPHSVVTYWQGPGGYRLTADHNTYEHNEFTFEWPDAIASVQVFKDAVPQTTLEGQITDLGTITKITLGEPTDTPHGDMEDPPMTLQPPGARP